MNNGYPYQHTPNQFLEESTLVNYMLNYDDVSSTLGAIPSLPQSQ
jgi:hypothetical protein